MKAAYVRGGGVDFAFNPSPASSSLSSPAVSTPQTPPNSYLLDTGSCKCIQFVVYFVWCFVYV